MSARPKFLSCSSNQERYLLASHFSEISYFLPLVFRLPLNVDIRLLMASVKTVFLNDEVLSSTYRLTKEATLVRMKAKEIALSVLSPSIQYDSDEEAIACAQEFIFDSVGPKDGINGKVALLNVSDKRWIFVVALHHIVADAISLGLFLERVSRTYKGLPQQQVPFSFSDLVERHALHPSTPSEVDRTFWSNQLSGVGNKTGTLPILPVPGPADQSRGRVETAIPESSLCEISKQAVKMGVTQFEYVFAAYLFLLARMTGAEGACATFQSSGRRKIANSDLVIGVFSNALPVLLVIENGEPFDAFVKRLRGHVRASLEHESTPYHQIISETGYHPKFGINWYPGNETLDLLEISAEAERSIEWQSDFLLNLHCVLKGDDLSLMLSYPLGYESHERACVILDHLTSLLEYGSIGKCENLTELMLVGTEQYQSNIKPEREISNLIASPLAAHVSDALRQHGHRIAVTEGDRRASYADLEQLVGRLVARMLQFGIREGVRVAIQIPRSIELIVAVLASNQVGAVFAIFDPGYPDGRLASMREVFDPNFLIRWKRPKSISNEGLIDGIKLYTLTKDQHIFNIEQATYALFTSGTTGKPKCVLTSCEGLVRFVLGQIQSNDLANQRVVGALLAGLGHDPFLRDLFVPLIGGGCLHIPDRDYRDKNPRDLVHWLESKHVSVLNVTPQLSKLISLGFKNDTTLPDVRWVFWGGDILRAQDISDFLTHLPNAKGFNIYGATETPQAASLQPVSRQNDWRISPVGFGINGRKLTIRNGERLCGLGEPGEIIVSGKDLALGYYDVKDGFEAFKKKGGYTEYATGDVGMLLPNGAIAFISRSDHQVKIRGYRVDPSEIEACLEKINQVGRAAVISKQDAKGEMYLIGYVEAQHKSEQELVQICRELLPNYMIPNRIIIIKELPITPNGKVDRAALPAPVTGKSEFSGEDYAQTNQEEAIASIFCQILHHDFVPMTQSTEEIGVDSLSFLSLSVALEDEIGSLPANWERLSLRALAAQKQRTVWFSRVETPTAMRALSISAVVGLHTDLLSFSSATSALFMIAGHSFARFQIPQIIQKGSARSLLMLMAQIAIPTCLYTIFLQIYYSTFSNYTEIEPLTWLFLGNLIDPNAAGRLYFWYIDVLLQMLLLLAGMFSIPFVRHRASAKPYYTAVSFFIFAYSLSLLSPYFWNTDPLLDRVPTLKLWLIGLGWCLAVSKKRTEFMFTVILILGSFTNQYLFFDQFLPVTFIALALIIVCKYLVLPYPLNKVVFLIASASLFIYLTNFQFAFTVRKILNVMGMEGSFPLVETITALCGGIIVYKIWQKVSQFSYAFIRGLSQ